MSRHYIACDLGAESGRVMLGTLTDGKVSLKEIHRFPNGAINVNGGLRWDVLRLFDELKTGIRKVDVKAESLSCDSWGVDYVWLKGNEPFLTAPYQYRDLTRNDGAFDRAFPLVAADEIFAETGIQFMTINTAYQLHWDAVNRPWVFKAADRFLPIGDYFNFLFSGVAKSEVSLASTTQLYNPKKKKWSRPLLKKLGLPAKLFPDIVPSGTVLGAYNDIKVIATCSHDTGGAVAAVPAAGKGWAYLSSGTWSLVGIEAKKPIINEQSRQFNFTNEIGFGHSIRFLKNIIGLWILQECRRAWGGKYDYAELAKLAEAAAPLRSLINPNDERFGQPDNMPDKIAAFCRETGQPVPANEGAYVRCILESLALLYRKTLDQIEQMTGKSIKTLHIVGGGSQNTLLNQLSANATGRTVVTGPVEATAIGNILIQAIALGHLKDLDELRQVVRNSFAVQTYKPQGDWQSASERFQKLTQ
ncbi:MAG: Rhamnulokinase [Verrucomicrobiae bacterium]|nr:Rhamnulokinase [Verrucomicrobiae bacterium]